MKPTSFISRITIIFSVFLSFYVTSDLYSQRPGIECGCETYKSYVKPAVAVPAMGEKIDLHHYYSPKKKYILYQESPPPPNLGTLTITDSNNVVIHTESSTACTWGFDPSEKYFAISGTGTMGSWAEYLVLDPDKSTMGEQAEAHWICEPTIDMTSHVLVFSPHGKHVLFAGITGPGELYLKIVNTATQQVEYTHPGGDIASTLKSGSGGWGFSSDKNDATFMLTYFTSAGQYALFLKRLDTPSGEYLIQSTNTSNGGGYRFSPCGDYFVWINRFAGTSSPEMRFYPTHAPGNYTAVDPQFYGAVTSYEDSTYMVEHYKSIDYTENGHFIMINDAGAKYPVDLPMANTTCPDESAPDWPGGAELTASSIEGTRIKLHWPKAEDNIGVTWYGVYNGSSLMEELGGTDTTYLVTGLQPETPGYNLGVKAGDETGNRSDKLGNTFDTEADHPPYWTEEEKAIVPSDLISTEVVLVWTGAGDDWGVEGYAVFAGAMPMDTVGGTNTYTARNLKPDSSYVFRVEAYDAAGQWSSGGPEITIITPPDPAPEWPVDSVLNALEITETSILLQWCEANDPQYGVNGYEVYRDGELIHTTHPFLRQYYVTGLEKSTVYHFVVMARDDAGNSSPLERDISTLSPYIEKPLIVLEGEQSAPDIDGNIIVWQDNRNGGNYDIYMYNLETKTETRITDNDADQLNPRNWGERVVWEDWRNGNGDIYMHDPVLGEVPICVNEYLQTAPDIWGTRIVWSDSRDWKTDIYMYDLETQQETLICGADRAQYTPCISKNFIAWMDYRNSNQDIYMYNLVSGEESPVCTRSGDQSNPSVYAEGRSTNIKIAYLDKSNSSIYVYYPFYWASGDPAMEWKPDLYPVSRYQDSPHIDKDKLVYLGNKEGDDHVYEFRYVNDVAGDAFPVCLAEGGQEGPRTSQDRVVWTDFRNGNADIYLWDRPPGSDLVLSLEESEDPVKIGRDIVYRLSIENTGPDDAEGITITCPLPELVFPVSDTMPGYVTYQEGNALKCDIPLLPNEETLTWTLKFSTPQTGKVTFTASVIARVFDPDPSNNQVTETTEISFMTREIPGYAFNSGMFLPPDGSLHVCFVSNDTLYYSRKTGSSVWQVENLGYLCHNNYNNYCDVVADRSGRIHIVASRSESVGQDSSEFFLYHYIKTGDNWERNQIGYTYDGFYYLDLELGSNDELHLSYLHFFHHAATTPVMYMRTTNQQWGPPRQVTQQGYDNISLAVDSDDHPHLSFYCINSGIGYSTKDGPGEWGDPEVMDPHWWGGQLEGLHTCIDLDAQNNPHVSFAGNDPDWGSESIKLGIKTGDAWEFCVVDSGAAFSTGNAIDVDNSGRDHLLYAYHKADQLRYAFRHGDCWIRQIIDPYCASSEVNIKADPFGNIHMLYQDWDWDEDEPILRYVMRPPMPYITASPDQLDFGSLEIGEDSEKTVLIHNPGQKEVFIDSISVVGGPGFAASNESRVMGAHESDSIRVIFKPEEQGQVKAVLRIWFNGTEKMFVDVGLLGRTPSPHIELHYESERFEAPVGGSDTNYFYVLNTGDLPLEISNVEVERKFGPTTIETDFSLLGHDCTTIAPGDSCEIRIAFSPQEEGYQLSYLYVYSNDPERPERRPSLEGRIAYPKISASSYEVNFGYVPPGSSGQEEITITNSGVMPVEITSFELGGEDPDAFTLSHDCSSLDPGDSCILTVEFNPTGKNDFEAQILPVSNTKYTYTIYLKATSLLRELSVSPEHADFGSLDPGEDTLSLIEITNTGETTIQNINVKLRGINPWEFSHSGSPDSLQADEVYTDTIRFLPAFPGIKSAEWILEYPGIETMRDTVHLSGTGLAEPEPLKISAGADPLKGLIPLEINFMSTSMGGSLPYQFQWEFGDGNTSTDEDPVHTFAQPGKYKAKVRVLDAGDNEAADSIMIMVGAELVPVVNIRAQIEPSDTIAIVRFNADYTGGRIPIKFHWDFGDGKTSAYPDPVHVFGSSGTYPVKFTLTDALGNTAKDSLQISFSIEKYSLSGKAFSQDSSLAITSGTADLFRSGNAESLEGQLVSGSGEFVFENLNKGDYIVLFTPDTISFPGVLPTYSGGALTLYDAGAIHLEDTVRTAHIYCINNPDGQGGPGIVSGTVVLTEGVPGIKSESQYNGEGSPVPGIMVYLVNLSGELAASDRTGQDGSFSFTGLANGEYTLLVDYKGIPMKEGNGTIQISGASGIIRIHALISETSISLEEIVNVKNLLSPDGRLKIYPNPAKDILVIEPADRGNPAGSVRIEIYTIPGVKMMDTGTIDFPGRGIEMNIRSLDPGNYFMRIHHGEKHYQSVISIL